VVRLSETAVRAALEEVVDPCSVVAGAPTGIVSLGLVRKLELSHDERGTTVRLSIGVTEPGCLMGASFAAQARARLELLAGVAEIDIELDHANDWMPSDIDPGYQRRLDLVRATRRHALEQRRAAAGPNPERGAAA
jgi:metal-sulfur cluster biosynthetic enzyme